MTDRPVILLDVDGVLNACPHRDPEKVGFTDFRVKLCDGFKITHSLEMGERLIALDADIVWLTTWENRSNTLIGPLFGWPEFPVLEGGEEWYRPGWWKSTVAEKFIRENPRPFVWIDDDLADAEDNGEIDWVGDVDLPHFGVAPLTTTGLTPLSLAGIELFLWGLTNDR